MATTDEPRACLERGAGGVSDDVWAEDEAPNVLDEDLASAFRAIALLLRDLADRRIAMSELFEGAQDAEEMDLILAVAAHQETMAETLLWLGKVLPASRERRDAFMFSSSLGHIEASALRERAADYEARALKTLGGKAIDQ